APCITRSTACFSPIRSIALHTFLFFFFNDPAPTEIYTLSLHDALPISSRTREEGARHGPTAHRQPRRLVRTRALHRHLPRAGARSEEHTSELQSRENLVCRLLLEKKKNKLKQKGGVAETHAEPTSTALR